MIMTEQSKFCLSRQFPGCVWAVNEDGSVAWNESVNGRALPEESEYLTEENIAAYLASTVYQWTCHEFYLRFTAEEREAIIVAGRTIAAVEDLRSRLLSAPVIHSNSADLLAGMSALVSLGLLTQQRKDEILGIVPT